MNARSFSGVHFLYLYFLNPYWLYLLLVYMDAIDIILLQAKSIKV